MWDRYGTSWRTAEDQSGWWFEDAAPPPFWPTGGPTGAGATCRVSRQWRERGVATAGGPPRPCGSRPHGCCAIRDGVALQAAVSRPRRFYDHRIRDEIIATGSADLFPDLDIPRSTTRTWLRRGANQVVRLECNATGENAQLRARLVTLERRMAMLTAVLRLILTLVRIRGARLEMERLSDEADRRRYSMLSSALAR